MATTPCGRDDRTCGAHTGIPPCCVDWYVRVWLPFLRRTTWGPTEPANIAYLEQSRAMPDYVQYKPCPGCRHVGAYVVIRRCPPDGRPIRGPWPYDN
jgi:hypothetical protein